jgi:predicted transcriptional regulator
VKSAGKTVAKHPSTGSGGSSDLKPPFEAILQAMGKLRAIGQDNPKRTDVQTFSGNAKTYEGFKKNLGSLRSQYGLVDFPCGQTVTLTEKGIQHVGEVDRTSVTNESAQELMKELLAPKAREILHAMVDGASHDRNAIAEQLGYDMSKLSGFNKNVSRMKTLDIVSYPTKTTIQLTDRCFPLGRPTE